MNDATRICTKLITAGPVRRDELPELDHSQIRAEVERNLQCCGMSLATSAYSNYYGLQLLPEIADPTVLDAPTNLGLGTNACALLMVLWARLALQHRTAEDTQSEPTEQVALLPQERTRRVRAFEPSIRFETLAQEFGTQLGGRTRLHALVSQLRRLGFVSYRTLEDIQAGPLLELAIDGERMIAFIRSRVLGQLLARGEPQAAMGGSAPNEKRTPTTASSNVNPEEKQIAGIG